MSLRTKINGFTAWVNLRLTPYNHLLNNVLMDLLSGTHMKYFVESFTGRDLKRLENMDGLSEQQKQTRVDWMVEELKKCSVIPDDVFVDTRLFAMRSADHVFDLLWRLISHDIWFVWERVEYLQVEDLDVLTQVPFKWTPEPPPRKKKSKSKAKKSLLSGFGASSVTDDRNDDTNSYRSATGRIELRQGDLRYSRTVQESLDGSGIIRIGRKSYKESTNQNKSFNESTNQNKPFKESTDQLTLSKESTNQTILRKESPNQATLSNILTHEMKPYKERKPRSTSGSAATLHDEEVVQLRQDFLRNDFDNMPYINQGPQCTTSNEINSTYKSQIIKDATDLNDTETVSDSQSELARKEMVSIYIVPLRVPEEDIVEGDVSNFEGRHSPFPFSDNAIDNDQTDCSDWKNECLLTDDTASGVTEEEMTNREKQGEAFMDASDEDTRAENIDSNCDNFSVKYGLKKTSSELNLLKISLEESLKLSQPSDRNIPGRIGDWIDTELQWPKEEKNPTKKATLSKQAKLFQKSSDMVSHHVASGSKDSVVKGDYFYEKGGNFAFNQEEFCFPIWQKTIKSQSEPVTRRGSWTSDVSHDGKGNRHKKRKQNKQSSYKYIIPVSKDMLKSVSMPALSSSEMPAQKDDDEKWIRFPNADYMKGFKKKKYENKENYPSPDGCILEMINFQLKNTRDGKGIFCYSIDDFVDSRVLCALVNSFVPNTFTADLLLNDRWTINLALKTAEKMFYAETPFDAEDLVEADPMAVSAYFAFFLMVAYRYRQTTAVVNRVDFINMLIRECNHELDKYPAIIANMSELQTRKDLKHQLDQHRQAIEKIQKKFDIDFCRKWVQHVEHVQRELRREIRDKMRMRFEIAEVPRNISINDFCLAAVINLTLTNGSGFYMTTAKEALTEGRRLVLRRKETGEFIEDFTNKSKATIKDTLRLPDSPNQVLEVNPEDYPDFEFYFEAPSRNKQLKAGTLFLYQVFPGNTVTWQRLFIKSARDAEFETVEKMIAFFREDSSFINCKEPKSGNTALHLACRMGHFDIVRLLLENGANLDVKNNFRCAPINLAIEALQRRVCHLLIEWGCDVHSRNVKGQTVLETIKNDDFKRFAMGLYDYYSDIVPKVMNGDMELLDKVLAEHVNGLHEFCCLRSRCINGSTLLHTACYYGHLKGIKELLSLRVDVNICDYKGATPLHRAKDPDVMELLLDAGAHVNAEDSESNTPLHVKCYGETSKPSETECIQMLLNKSASLIIRNSRGLMPIHCCVMQGRIDVMQMLLQHDKSNSMLQALSKENQKKPPSLCHLAIANDFPDCAEWLISNGFQFKDKEQDILMRRILTEQIKLTKRADCIKFLLDNGAEPSPKYPAGNTALHYAAGLSGPSDVLEILVAYRAEIDGINDEGCTPLFFATQSNNKFAACVLIEQGANVRQKNSQGFTALDYIVDFEEWIECGYFGEEIKARLKAYNLKHARDLIRAISKRVKPNTLPFMRQDIPRSAYTTIPSSGSTQYRTGTSWSTGARSTFTGGHSMLPPVMGNTGQKYIMY